MENERIIELRSAIKIEERKADLFSGFVTNLNPLELRVVTYVKFSRNLLKLREDLDKELLKFYKAEPLVIGTLPTLRWQPKRRGNFRYLKRVVSVRSLDIRLEEIRHENNRKLKNSKGMRGANANRNRDS